MWFRSWWDLLLFRCSWWWGREIKRWKLKRSAWGVLIYTFTEMQLSYQSQVLFLHLFFHFLLFLFFSVHIKLQPYNPHNASCASLSKLLLIFRTRWTHFIPENHMLGKVVEYHSCNHCSVQLWCGQDTLVSLWVKTTRGMGSVHSFVLIKVFCNLFCSELTPKKLILEYFA